MSLISERICAAGWIDGLEFKLWHAAFDPQIAETFPHLRDDEVRRLQELSDRCSGWIVFDEELEEAYVPIAEWKKLVAKANN
jgi:hypothetical protein